MEIVSQKINCTVCELPVSASSTLPVVLSNDRVCRECDSKFVRFGDYNEDDTSTENMPSMIEDLYDKIKESEGEIEIFREAVEKSKRDVILQEEQLSEEEINFTRLEVRLYEMENNYD